jgi:hypothetical protein
MPTVSSFLGITIRNCNDHLPPHFHAEHGDDEALITINPIGVYEGHLPTRSLRLVLAWAELHQAALETNWAAARAMQPLQAIPPLS